MDKVKQRIPAITGMNRRPVTSPLSGIMALMCKKSKRSETTSKSMPAPNQRFGEAFFICGAFLMCILSCILDARSSDRTGASPFPRIIATHCTRRQKGIGNRGICRYFRRCGMVSVDLLCGCLSPLVRVAKCPCSLERDTGKPRLSKYTTGCLYKSSVSDLLLCEQKRKRQHGAAASLRTTHPLIVAGHALLSFLLKRGMLPLSVLYSLLRLRGGL